jgi:CheY-like chemotaxis protein
MNWEKPKVGKPPCKHDVPRKKGLTILIAEDERINQLYLREMLKSAGHTVVCANNGLEACRIFERQRFDVVFLDVQMPVLDGVGAVERMRRFEKQNCLPRTKIVALTAYSLQQDRDEFFQKGMDRLLSKPIVEKNLIQALQQ